MEGVVQNYTLKISTAFRELKFIRITLAFDPNEMVLLQNESWRFHELNYSLIQLTVTIPHEKEIWLSVYPLDTQKKKSLIFTLFLDNLNIVVERNMLYIATYFYIFFFFKIMILIFILSPVLDIKFILHAKHSPQPGLLSHVTHGTNNDHGWYDRGLSEAEEESS